MKQKMNKTKPWVVYVAALLISVISLLAAFEFNGFMRPFANETANATITQSSYLKQDGKYDSPRFSIEYNYIVGGKEYTGSGLINETKKTISSKNDLVDKQIHVNYVKNNPIIHYIEDDYNSWILSYVYASIALVLFIGVVLHLFKYSYFDELLIVAGILVIIISVLWITSKVSRIINLYF